MRNLTTIFILLSAASAFACQLNLPESEVRRALAGPVSGHYVTCDQRPGEKCFSCFENIDPETHDLISGELVENADKKFAKELKEKNEKDAAKAKEEKCKNFSFKGSTIAQLRQELNDSMECRK